MHPEINPMLSSFVRSNKGNKNKKIDKKKKKSKVKNQKTFGEYFHEITVDKIFEEFKDYDPENLIEDIVDAGKRYKNYFREEDLNQYKYLLSGFLTLTSKEAYQVGFMKQKKSFIDIEEKYYTIVQEIKKKYTAMQEYVVLSQQDIIKLVKDVEGLIVNIKV